MPKDTNCKKIIFNYLIEKKQNTWPTRQYVFDSLKESATNWEEDSVDLGSNSVYRYKPDKFNEIVQLTETESKHELANKDILLRLSNTKV